MTSNLNNWADNSIKLILYNLIWAKSEIGFIIWSGESVNFIDDLGPFIQNGLIRVTINTVRAIRSKNWNILYIMIYYRKVCGQNFNNSKDSNSTALKRQHLNSIKYMGYYIDTNTRQNLPERIFQFILDYVLCSRRPLPTLRSGLWDESNDAYAVEPQSQKCSFKLTNSVVTNLSHKYSDSIWWIEWKVFVKILMYQLTKMILSFLIIRSQFKRFLTFVTEEIIKIVNPEKNDATNVLTCFKQYSVSCINNS